MDITNLKNITGKNIIYFINSNTGFGSQITLYLYKSYYINKYINDSIIILPLWINNGTNFKYHEKNIENSFYLYFKNKKEINYNEYNKYYINIDNVNLNIFEPFFSFSIPINNNIQNKIYLDFFREKYELNIGENIKEYIKNIRKENHKLIGIHIRSINQKIQHDKEYLNINIKDRLINIKNKLEKNSIIFIATDTNVYINYCKDIFDNFNYLDFISRIDNEEDSIPSLNDNGFKLGSDIIYDCLALSLCDKIYVSYSNIPYIVNILNKDIEMEEY